MKNYSLKNKLMVSISIPVFSAVLILIVMSYLFARYEIEEVYDAQLVHSAKVLLQLTKNEILRNDKANLGHENPDMQHKYERKLGFRIWLENTLVLQSNITEKFKDLEAPLGFSDQYIGGDTWRYFVFFEPESHIKIEVLERYDIRYEVILQLMFSLLVPLCLFIPVLLVIIHFGIRSVLKPVVTVSKEVDHRNTEDLSPIEVDHLPREIMPLISALNRLFERIKKTLTREREFTDHAAHELRTPLAAMKTQSQVLLKKAKKNTKTAAGFKNLESSINRATRLVDQLLSLARLQNESLPLEKVNLSNILDVVYQNYIILAEKKSITLSLRIDKEIFVEGVPDTIMILLSNILDNAIKYTPENGEVTIELDQNGFLKFADTGSGLSDEEKKKVFDRFVRVDKTGQTGSGLGLSIVKWIADSQSIGIELLDNIPKGLIVALSFQTRSS